MYRAELTCETSQVTAKCLTRCAYIYRLFTIKLLKPTSYVMYQQFNIQQFCILPTLYIYHHHP